MKLGFILVILALNSSAYAMTIIDGLNAPGPSRDLTLPRIIPTVEKSEPPIVTGIGNLLGIRLKKMRERNEKYASANFSVGDRWTYSCAETCACLTRKFAEVLKANGIPHRSLVIHTGRDYRVRLRTYKSALESYDYHEVTVLKLAGRWRVIDVIGTGTTKPEPLADWIKRLENPQLKRASIY